MEIKNHRSGETCTLSFKPRGWRAKDSFEIKGVVKDAKGAVKWDIAGRWNSQLVARKAGVGHGTLEPDANLPTTGGAASTPHILPEYILLWKNTVKPPAPFNLTPFAITLNDLPPGLSDWVAPTDCRMRPDQRAFELAKYELANTLKQDQETKQREIRKLRETGQMPPHAPRWFNSSVDKDTGERVWEPKRTAAGEIEYWAERVRAHEAGQWTNVVRPTQSPRLAEERRLIFGAPSLPAGRHLHSRRHRQVRTEPCFLSLSLSRPALCTCPPHIPCSARPLFVRNESLAPAPRCVRRRKRPREVEGGGGSAIGDAGRSVSRPSAPSASLPSGFDLQPAFIARTSASEDSLRCRTISSRCLPRSVAPARQLEERNTGASTAPPPEG
jgi:hypothetical protein